MKTNKFFAILFTLSMVIFASVSGISNTANDVTGDNLKKGGNSTTSGTKSEISTSVTTDFSYLRFDVNECATESAIKELPIHTFDYLRFDVNNFVNENETAMELPAANEFNYLRFDVNTFIESNPVGMSEIPANEYEYLSFDANNFISLSASINELPIPE